MRIDPEADSRTDAIEFVGQPVNRPECVLCTRTGHFYSSDWRGGVAHHHPDGSQTLYSAQLDDGRPLRPNGFAMQRDGSFLLADLGDTEGGVFELRRDNTVRPFLQAVDSIELPPTNFVLLDHQGRIWITVSTRLQPRALGYNAGCRDGFIILVDSDGARIVADGLGYTNECVVSVDGKTLWVNETFGRRLSRFDIRPDGQLVNQFVVTEFGTGIYPDGLAMDTSGDFWATSIVSNRVVQVHPDGEQIVWLQDANPVYVEKAEEAYLAGCLGREHLDGIESRRLGSLSSLAFGGADLRTAYLGCLLGDHVGTIRMPAPGVAPAHWTFDG
ncbi:MAG: SMP-30/gluconolactonase/LRE family protein [Burkholderiaceae bacterium]